MTLTGTAITHIELGSRPLITYLLLSYNQERFIREAVEGAFAQTYSPLEIILSDDCSSDRTFEIMSEMVASYQGPHKIVLNRNQRNLGIGEHMNRVLELVSGELIVGAAGDDISVSERTSRIYEEWQRIGGGICSIYSDALIIDENGRQLGRFYGDRAAPHSATVEEAIIRGGVGVAGCSHVYSTKTFEIFGTMDDRVYAEDSVIAFRNLLLGKIGYIAEPLVLYRSHGGNVSMRSAGRPTLEKRYREKANHEAVLLTWLHDIGKASAAGLLAGARADHLATGIYTQLQRVSLEKRFYRQPLLSGLLLLARELFGLSRLKLAMKIVERRLRCSPE